jgi:microtubule-associated protein-like 1/2
MLQFFLHGRPYNVYPPSHTTTNFDTILTDVDAPKTKLTLEWVYGYRGRDCRNNLHYLPTGELIYFTAAIVVLHNVDDGTQRHYTQHTSDIKWYNGLL